MDHIIVKQVSPRHADLHRLVGHLDGYLRQLYPAEEIFGVDFDDPFIERTVFLVAYVNDIPAGCGATRPLDRESLELKRFFVEPAFRQKGIAGQILLALEGRAKEAGYGFIKLETGGPQREAVRFYRKHGYGPIERFGEYVDCESSLCYEKRL